MEFLESIGEFFNSILGMIERFITRLFGASNERLVRRIGFDRRGDQVRIIANSPLDRINHLEPEYEKKSESELQASSERFRARLKDGETLDDILPEAFAAVREAGKRFLRMRHYDVQMVGGYVLHKGMIAEMMTGEGKTLVSTLPAYLNALAGSVHVVTVNDYLARRDMEWMAPLHMGLGLKIGAIQADMPTNAKIKAYQCDITYGTNNEFGFDYLRDNMKPRADMQVQGPLNYAIVDEIDNILIDEARTPLIISGPAHDDVRKYAKANQVAAQLRKGQDFEVKEKEHTCHMTEDGIRRAEELAGVDSFYTAGNMEWPHLIDNALKAYHLYKRDVNYVVQGDEIIIVDEFTGRLMPGRNWSDGLHQAVEAKEGVRIKEENQTLATITLQNFFKLYKKLGGMTGTAMTEANEFWKIYKLDVVAVPTNRPSQRKNFQDVIYRSEREKFNAIVEEIKTVHGEGRPILVGTVSIEKSELLSNKLNKFGIKHQVLNAKHHEREAEIIAQAGRKGAVTIATNMAGRGTDIILGGNPEPMAWEELKEKYETRLEVPKHEWDSLTKKIADAEGRAKEGREVATAGGLHVIGSERHEARRIDLQLRGRSGRQGDPGSSRFFLSLEDDLMRIFGGEWVKGILEWVGMQEGEAIESRMVSKRIEGAQRKVEERNFEIRKNLLEYDEVMDQQRKRVYTFRQSLLEGASCREEILSMLRARVNEALNALLDPHYGASTVTQWAAHQYGLEIDERDLRNRSIPEVEDYLRDQAERQAEDLIREQIDADLPSEEEEREWNWASLSRWANARWGLNTNDRELKKEGRANVGEYLSQRARDAIGRYDFSPLQVFLAEDWGRKALCNWLAEQYTLQMQPAEFEGKSVDEAIALVNERLQQLYVEKEIEFPVAVGMTRFMADHGNTGGEKYDRDGLIHWAATRFETPLDEEDLKNKGRDQIRQDLEACSRKFFHPNLNHEKIDEYLDQAYPAGHGDSNGSGPSSTAPLDQLAQWAGQEYQLPVSGVDLKSMSRTQALNKVVDIYDVRYRPELREAERALILEVLDTAWKDHLYFMDHLRQGIGLAGYAGKDPKVEYKREGMKAFDGMWKRIGEQITTAIFRLEEMNPEFVGNLWEITSTIKEDAGSALDSAPPPQQGGGQMQTNSPDRPSGEKAIDPIRNRGPRVGRNDPCPCGSGKKFKNCHMQE
ncbi:MAG: preprotein translocase subunit SecA [Planctomycetales bacterium]